MVHGIRERLSLLLGEKPRRPYIDVVRAWERMYKLVVGYLRMRITGMDVEVLEPVREAVRLHWMAVSAVKRVEPLEVGVVGSGRQTLVMMLRREVMDLRLRMARVALILYLLKNGLEELRRKLVDVLQRGETIPRLGRWMEALLILAGAGFPEKNWRTRLTVGALLLSVVEPKELKYVVGTLTIPSLLWKAVLEAGSRVRWRLVWIGNILARSYMLAAERAGMSFETLLGLLEGTVKVMEELGAQPVGVQCIDEKAKMEAEKLGVPIELAKVIAKLMALDAGLMLGSSRSIMDANVRALRAEELLRRGAHLAGYLGYAPWRLHPRANYSPTLQFLVVAGGWYKLANLVEV